MKKMIIIVFAIFFLFMTLVAEVPLYSVKGKIHYQKQGVIYLFLLNEELYQAKNNRQTPYQLSIVIGPEQLKDKSVSFEIPNVPRGRYCLVCYQDINDNKQLDKGLFCPTEPWCIYNKPQGAMGRPQFKDIAFYVVKDISAIEIELQ